MPNINYWDYNYALWLFHLLKNSGLTDEAAAGVLGNIYQESAAICPFCVEGHEGSYTDQWDITVNTVRPSTRNEFMKQTYTSGGAKGYGLAQWTESSRKGAYWDYTYQDGSITKDHTWLGDTIRDGHYLIVDLSNWSMHTSCDENYWTADHKTTWQWLTDPNVSLSDAVLAVLMIYERPYLASHGQASVEYNLRYNYAYKIYQDMVGQPPPDPPTPPGPTPPPQPVTELEAVSALIPFICRRKRRKFL